MARPIAKVLPLLFVSGACSLTYETVWLRELRLVFGASTMASAAVVACFVGGLGVGGLVFGRRADRASTPLALYAWLEGGIALSAAVSPALIALSRALYVAIGGTGALGAFGGTALRIALASVVFAVPTTLMGGTLPAAARAIEEGDDQGRRDLSRLYGVNTLGAVVGCLASTFFLFEIFGNRLTLWLACLLNALVAVIARSLSRSLPPREGGGDARPSREVDSPAEAASSAPTWLVLAAAGVAGFVFCLMELVWYRMLAPLLGGSVFTFGLILAIALAGMGMGGVAYGLRSRARSAELHGFAWTCLLEAFFVAVPYALGNRLAIVAALLNPLGSASFFLRVASWSVTTFVVVAPASFLTGVQFPMLIGLLGAGDRNVGRDVGRVVATNTVGSVLGSVAGGFGLIATLTAPGCWRLAVALLVVVGVTAAARSAKRHAAAAALALVVAGLACWLVGAEGPTAAWRDSPIGAGRVDASGLRTPNEITAWEHDRRRAIEWQVDGRESSVAIDKTLGVAFIVNGKSDGAARSDAGTSVMAGILGAILHPNPTRALVVGLGTGETAGWLGAIPSIEDVDVFELEPAILEVARRCAALNHDALANPRVHVTLGDARELLLTSSHRYSLVMSEPSNPYRSGIASLFTQSFYAAVRDRLDDDGIFLQWLQGYDVDAHTVRTVMATVASVFPEVETWELTNADLLLVASKRPIVHDLARLRRRLMEEPYRSAAGKAWRAHDVPTFLSHFVATSGLARRVAAEEGANVNTDDQNVVEFGFAHAVGGGAFRFSIADVRGAARARGEDQVRFEGDAGVDWGRVEEARFASKVAEETLGPEVMYSNEPDRAHRVAALRAFDRGDMAAVVSEWTSQPDPPADVSETAFLAFALADAGDPSAASMAEVLRAFEPPEADAIVARMYLRQGKVRDAAEALGRVFAALRVDPWPMERLMRAAFVDAREVARRDPELATALYAALREPFVARVHDAVRQSTAFAVTTHTSGAGCVEAAKSVEPNVPWNEDFLRARYRCYRSHDPARAPAAEGDLRAFLRAKPAEFGAGLSD